MYTQYLYKSDDSGPNARSQAESSSTTNRHGNGLPLEILHKVCPPRLRTANNRAAFVETSVYLVVAAAVYLACKIEECPQHIKTVTQEIQTVWGLGRVSSDPTKLAEAEFYLINELDTYLIVYHPYRVLTLIVEHFKVPQRDVDESWLIINDSYSTDIPLLFSPDVIAYTALYMTVIRRRYASAHESIQKFRVQFNALHLDVKELANCTAMFLSFWAFRNTSKVDAKQSLKRAIEQLDSEDASLAEKEQRSRHYKEKIMALQKN